jgi:hypothetical protein
MTTQNTNNRLAPSVLNADQDIFEGLQTITDYAPYRKEASISQIEQAQVEMLKSQKLEAQLKAQYRAALDVARQSEWMFHNTILEAKNAVVAQFGSDSSEAQIVGLKKKSAYKRPVRQKKSA